MQFSEKISELYSLKGKFFEFGGKSHGALRNAIATYIRFYKFYYSHNEIDKNGK